MSYFIDFRPCRKSCICWPTARPLIELDGSLGYANVKIGELPLGIMRRGVLLLTLLFSFSFAQIASAHGGEESPGLSNIQVLIISSASSIVFFILFAVVKQYEAIVARSSLYSLVLFTAAVHILLGVDDLLVITGGVGVLSATFIPMIFNFSKRVNQLADFALASIVLSMLIGYFVYNHDLHLISEDYLGIITKLVELGILFMLFKQHVFTQRGEED